MPGILSPNACPPGQHRLQDMTVSHLGDDVLNPQSLQGTAEAKIAALESAGVTVVRSPAEMGVAMQAALGV